MKFLYIFLVFVAGVSTVNRFFVLNFIYLKKEICETCNFQANAHLDKTATYWNECLLEHGTTNSTIISYYPFQLGVYL